MPFPIEGFTVQAVFFRFGRAHPVRDEGSRQAAASDEQQSAQSSKKSQKRSPRSLVAAVVDLALQSKSRPNHGMCLGMASCILETVCHSESLPLQPSISIVTTTNSSGRFGSPKS